MTTLEFKEKIGEVERFYSKEYVNEQKNELYKYFKEHTLKQFGYIISKVYQKCKFLPSIAEIIEIEKEIPFSKIRRVEKTDCKNCGGKGYVFYYKTIKDVEYQFIAYCNCIDEYKYSGKEMKDPRNKQPYHVMGETEAMQLGFLRK